MILNIDNWLPKAGEEEEGVMLCNIQPREGTFQEELTVNWNGLASSEAIELTLLIKNYVYNYLL